MALEWGVSETLAAVLAVISGVFEQVVYFFQEVFLLIAHHLARLGAHNGIALVSLTCLVPDEGVQ
jgi:hypothetical protein